MTTAQTPLEVLKAARGLLSDPNRWVQGSFEKVREGQTCFCALGALEAVTGGHYSEPPEVLAALLVTGGLADWHDLAKFNDSHTHAEVLDLFDRTIARLESEAA